MSDDKTKDLLISAATKLFSEKGYDGVSVKEIASEANANIAAISYHFGGKEGLYRACIENFGKARLQMAERILTSPETFEDFRTKLQLFVEEIIGCHLDEEHSCKIVHRDCEMQNPITEEIFKTTFLKVFDKMTHFFFVATQKDILRSDLDPFVTASFFFSGIIQFVRSDEIRAKYFGRSIKDPKFRQTTIKTILTIYLEGLQRKATVHESKK